MANTTKALSNIITDISVTQAQKSGYSQVITAEVISLENPFTKEYKVRINGVPVVAYGIYDIVYAAGTNVAVLEAQQAASKDRYIISATSSAADQLFNFAALDKYDQVSAPIALTPSNDQQLNIELPSLNHPYCRISADFTPIDTDLAFESKLVINFDKGDPVVYSSDAMEGSLIPNTKTVQLSPYFKIPVSATKIIKVFTEDSNANSAATWENVSITVYNEVQDFEKTIFKLIPIKGTMVTEQVTELAIEAKLRQDYQRVAPEDIQILWFRENPTIHEDDDKYNVNAGAGWEQVIPGT